MGKLPVNLKLSNKEFADELHIYPNVGGVMISWKACKALAYYQTAIRTHLLAPMLSHPVFRSPLINTISANTATPLLTKDSVITEFPTVFDGVIRAMDGEQFHIHLSTMPIHFIHPLCIS